jgi:hypothetical protein
MKYTKPEVAVLGEANQVIESTGIKPGVSSDGQAVNPAYDLDE